MNQKIEWEKSYERKENFLFYPHEEVIRFISKFVRKRIGLNEFQDVKPDAKGCRILDFGCGIGRHVMYCDEMGIESYGVDLSETAISIAKQWARQNGIERVDSKIVQGEASTLPWESGFFDFAISHGVLDSMSFANARQSCAELHRVLKRGGLFYCDLVSGDDSNHSREYCGEEIVKTGHESGTIQNYYNAQKINELIGGLFKIVECNLVRRENIHTGVYTSRYHAVLECL